MVQWKLCMEALHPSITNNDLLLHRYALCDMWALVYRLCSRLEENRLTLFPPPIEASVIVFVCT